jgi:tol-pal system protein YbgF
MRRVLALALVALITGCASTPPEDDPVQIKLKDIDERLSRVERIVTNQSLVELAQHLDEVQSAVRELRGRVDELENSSQAMRKQQRDLYGDLDKRLSGLQGGAAVGGAAAGSLGGPSGGGPSGGPSGGSAIPPGPSPSASGNSPPAANTSVEQAVYNQAFDSLKAGSYSTAITGFKDFLMNYSSSPLAENAQYWLGEAYYVTRDYDGAGTAFRAVLDKYPGSRKAADALLKLGYTQYEMKRYGDARKTLTEVTQKFPGSDAAKLATDRLSHMPADAH